MSDILRQRIVERIEELGMSPRSVSVDARCSPSYLADFLKGKTGSVTTPKLEAIARVLETTPQYLMGETFTSTKPVQSRSLPVMGRAAASIIGSQNIIEDAIEFTIAPPGLEGVKDAYCLWVEGDSMLPLYKPRDPIFVHPRQPVSRGDIVVIQEERDGAVYASVKEYAGKTDTHIVTLQYNPAGEVKFLQKHVYAMHRVLPLREVLNL